MPIPSFFCSLLLCRRGRAPPLLLLVFLLVVSTPRLPSNALFCSGSSKISFFLSAAASATGHRFTGLYLEWSVSCSAGISWGVTSIIRDLSLMPACYELLIHFFLSGAWKPACIQKMVCIPCLKDSALESERKDSTGK